MLLLIAACAAFGAGTFVLLQAEQQPSRAKRLRLIAGVLYGAALAAALIWLVMLVA